jgi:flagellar hook-length control protein FliK
MFLNSILFNLSSECSDFFGTKIQGVSQNESESFLETLQKIALNCGKQSQNDLSKDLQNDFKNGFSINPEKELEALSADANSENIFSEKVSLFLEDLIGFLSSHSFDEKVLSEGITDADQSGSDIGEGLKGVLEKLDSLLNDLKNNGVNLNVDINSFLDENMKDIFQEPEKLKELKSVLMELKENLERLNTQNTQSDKTTAGGDEKKTEEAQVGFTKNEIEESSDRSTKTLHGEEKVNRQDNAFQEEHPEKAVTGDLLEKKEPLPPDKKETVKKDKSEINPEQKQSSTSLKELSEKADLILEEMQKRSDHDEMAGKKDSQDNLNKTEAKPEVIPETPSGLKEVVVQKTDSDPGALKPQGLCTEVEPEAKMRPIESMESKNRNTDANIFHKESFIKEFESAENSSKERVVNRYVLDNTVLDQITDKMKKHLFLQGTNEIKLSLKPEFLGELKMNISVDKNVFKADVTVHSSLTKDIIDGSLDKLKQSLASQGLQMEKFSVTVGQEGSREAYHQEHQRRSFYQFQTGRVETEEDMTPLGRYIESGRLDFLI